MKAARKIKASNKLSTRGKHRSTKMFRMIPWESTLERDFIKVLDFDPSIVYYEFQPIRIDYIYQGKQRKYYPDFLVRKTDHKEYIYEVKDSSKIEDENTVLKTQVGIKYCQENNLSYAVVTEKDIRKGYLIDNLDLLSEVRNDSASRRIMVNIISAVKKSVGGISIGHLKKCIPNIDEGELECNIFHLIYTHELQVDIITYPINDQMIVERRI
ncbi:TnsA endonuclease N-terminal domain-containing protein [Bacillus sp. FJAT-27445]|uniref:TnsA endonuclease N-terminal domain-containing protein n=1 Tax=Bacillus sp. FJAT-27445 TaxID=1679166 RepID=UPI0007443C9A|nr:TnsA endonuclease N-terminal domain-containing protein [Bacillus sp. FJAT-27445]